MTRLRSSLEAARAAPSVARQMRKNRGLMDFMGPPAACCSCWLDRAVALCRARVRKKIHEGGALLLAVPGPARSVERQGAHRQIVRGAIEERHSRLGALELDLREGVVRRLRLRDAMGALVFATGAGGVSRETRERGGVQRRPG